MGIWINHHRAQLCLSPCSRASSHNEAGRSHLKCSCSSAPLLSLCNADAGHDWHPVASSPQQELLSELFFSFLFPWQLSSQLSSHPTCLNSSSRFECGSCKFVSMQEHGLVLNTQDRWMCCIWEIKLTCLWIKYWLRQLPSWKGDGFLAVACICRGSGWQTQPGVVDASFLQSLEETLSHTLFWLLLPLPSSLRNCAIIAKPSQVQNEGASSLFSWHHLDWEL